MKERAEKEFAVEARFFRAARFPRKLFVPTSSLFFFFFSLSLLLFPWFWSYPLVPVTDEDNEEAQRSLHVHRCTCSWRSTSNATNALLDLATQPRLCVQKKKRPDNFKSPLIYRLWNGNGAATRSCSFSSTRLDRTIVNRPPWDWLAKERFRCFELKTETSLVIDYSMRLARVISVIFFDRVSVIIKFYSFNGISHSTMENIIFPSVNISFVKQLTKFSVSRTGWLDD